jgi:macrolide-specific efflux system membrane fusion protein
MSVEKLSFLLTVLLVSPLCSAEKLAVQITPHEQVEVPARDAGVLVSLAVREGQVVAVNDTLGQVDDVESQLAVQRSQLERDIAVNLARNDIRVRFAKKSAEVAQAEVKRANESIEKFPKSVSATEVDRLRLAAERATLEIEQAQLELSTAQLTAQLKENELQLAKRLVSRRRLVAPQAGVVVQVHRKHGEWVEPGQPVLRLLRVDRLRASGFVDAKRAHTLKPGTPVTVSVELPGLRETSFAGQLIFVSPEVDPVNGQVRFWAEIENRDATLRSGLQGVLTVAETKPAERRSP